MTKIRRIDDRIQGYNQDSWNRWNEEDKINETQWCSCNDRNQWNQKDKNPI